MAAYKAKQNKALHKGWFVGYGVADGEVWTTNGLVAVRKKVTPDECKLLKDQQDNRGEQAMDLQPLYDTFKRNQTWPVHVHDANTFEYRSKRMQVDPVLFEYVEALYPKGSWFATEGKQHDYAQYQDDGVIVAMLAPIVKEG